MSIMNFKRVRKKVGGSFAQAAEWLHYLAATWIVFSSEGTGAVAVYLVAVAMPTTFTNRVRAGSLASPLALAALALAAGAPSIDMTLFVALGFVAGLGSGFAGRAVAWMNGVQSKPGAAGITGAVVGLVLVAAGMARQALVIAAVLLLAAAALGEEHEKSIRPPSVLMPALLAMAFVTGLRVLETGLFERPAAAGLFAVAWALGVEGGFRAAPQVDARIIVGAPFLAAAALAGAGAVEGPAIILLYGAVGAGVGLIGGTPSPDESRPRSLGWLFVFASLGAWWAAYGRGDFSTAAWTGALFALGGGFISSVLARRVPVPEAVTAAEPVPGMAPVLTPRSVPTEPILEAEPAQAEPELVPAAAEPELVTTMAPKFEGAFVEAALEDAATELVEALERARAIRGEALRTYRASMGSELPTDITSRIARVLQELESDLSEVASRLHEARAQVTPAR